MSCLVDTNVLARTINKDDPLYDNARWAIAALTAAGESLYTSPQNLVEFRCLATRPVERNGLGMSPADATAEVENFEVWFPQLPEVGNIYTEWKRLIKATSPSGKHVYDCRIVAYMLAHGLENLLTFDVSDFREFAAVAGIHVLDPRIEGAAEPKL